MILDLGCGTTKVQGAVGIDNVALPGVDVVHDLLEIPYPFDDNKADEIYLKHVIEHFVPADYQRILQEVHRLLTPTGVLHVRVPHIFSVAAWVDPTHKSFFTFLSGEFWTTHANKAYYRETQNLWHLKRTGARVTWFNWKRYRLRQLDSQLSRFMEWMLNRLLQWHNWPGAADLLVRRVPMFFVEVQWDFGKPSET
jgi:predicted SAM-dependent methyltransferase